MPNVFDYLIWRGDISFERVPLNEVDNLILSLLSYVPLDGIVPSFEEKGAISLRLAAMEYDRIHSASNGDDLGVLVPGRNLLKLFRAAARTERFGTMLLFGYVSRLDAVAQKQFSAVTMRLTDGTAYVAFRGTDDTIIGWKEDFNMSYQSPIPSQLEATAYLNRAGKSVEGFVYAGGHSKGGNLAVYAGVHCLKEVKDRIVWIYNNDGPGFDHDTMYEEGYREVAPRIKTYVPEYSVVGMLFERLESYIVVKSCEQKIMQHDGFSWELEGSGFITVPDTAADSKRIDNVLKSWVASIPKNDRQAYVDAVYELLTSTEATTLSELSTSRLKLLKSYLTMNSTSREVIHETTKILAKNMIDHCKKPKNEK